MELCPDLRYGLVPSPSGGAQLCMRFLPLVSSRMDPVPWRTFRDLELEWHGSEGAAWAREVRAGLAVHAVHLPPREWDLDLLRTAAEAVGTGLGFDFLVVHARPPGTRWGLSGFLGTLEGLLELCTPRGVKVALRPAKGATPRLLDILRDVHGEAVGFCWDADHGEDPEPIADRLHCAVGRAGSDPRPLQALGYRWNLALPAADPAAIAPVLERLRRGFPPVLFPAELPATALGRPVVPDPEVRMGATWGEP